MPFVQTVVLVALAGSAAPDTPVTGAAIVSTREISSTEYVLVVENRRDTSIEALRIDELGTDGRPRASHGPDFCLSDPAQRQPGSGRIQPRERREIRVYSQADRPAYALSLVLFDDMSFEGSVAARDDVLRRRAEQGYEYDFAVQALKAVPTLALRGIDGFLNGRKVEWERQLQEQGKQPGTGGPLYEAIRQAQESPEKFLAGVDFYRGVVEQQLTRLRRHLPPGGIAGAKLTIVDKSAKTLVVTIENHRDSPLVEWYVESAWASLSRRDAVAPRSRREFSTEFPVDPGVTGPARVAYAAFEDGYYEGSGRAFERWLAARDERREDLAYWTKALMSMPRISEPELRTFLSDHVAVRASGETHWTISHVSDRVQSLLLWVPQGGGIWPRIDQLRKEVEAEYLAVTRTPPEKQPGAAETGTAATVVSTDFRPAVSYTVILENLREVPIEAYSVADYDLARGRVSGWTGTDFCTSEPDAGRAGRGRIMPHEKRDLGAVFGSGPTVPLLKLYYVMFDDLQYEGEPVERVRLLKKREAQAEEHTFALAALDEAAGKPASELEAFLVQKREAYLRQMQRDGKGPAPAAQLEWFVGNIRRTSAERFAAEIPATRERLVGQIARLRRHLAP